MDFSLNRALNFVTKCPAAEKVRSASTLVEGIVSMPDKLDTNISTYFQLLQINPFLYLMKGTQHPVPGESEMLSIILLNPLAVHAVIRFEKELIQLHYCFKFLEYWNNH